MKKKYKKQYKLNLPKAVYGASEGAAAASTGVNTGMALIPGVGTILSGALLAGQAASAGVGATVDNSVEAGNKGAAVAGGAISGLLDPTTSIIGGLSDDTLSGGERIASLIPGVYGGIKAGNANKAQEGELMKERLALNEKAGNEYLASKDQPKIFRYGGKVPGLKEETSTEETKKEKTKVSKKSTSPLNDPEYAKKVKEVMNKIAYHESATTYDPKQKQIGGGPGRGLYQYEPDSLETAVNRVNNFNTKYNETTPEWFKNFDGKDITSLTAQQQTYIATRDALMKGNFKMADAISGDDGTVRQWSRGWQTTNDPVKEANFKQQLKQYKAPAYSTETPLMLQPVENEVQRIVGPSHEEGGVPVSTDGTGVANVEAEGGETLVGEDILSDTAGEDKNGLLTGVFPHKTFAQMSIDISNKFKNKSDSISQVTKKLELEAVKSKALNFRKDNNIPNTGI